MIQPAIALVIALLLAPQAVLVPDVQNPRLLHVAYSPFIDPAAFAWHAEVSQDMVQWWPFYADPGMTNLVYLRGNPNTFIRLVGVPWPTQ